MRKLRQTISALLDEQRGREILFAPVALGVGIALWFQTPAHEARLAVFMLALAVTLFGLVFSGRGRLYLLLGGGLIALGLVMADWQSQRAATHRLYHWLTAYPMTGVIKDLEVRQGGAYTRIHFLRDAMFDEPPLMLQLGMNGLPPPKVEPGARVEVRASLAPVSGPNYPGGYDPSRRAWFQSVAATGRILEPPKIVEEAKVRRMSTLRARLADAMAERLPEPVGAIAIALTVGDQGRVDPKLREVMQISGLAHLLAVSGFHVSAVAGLVFLFSRRLVGFFPTIALRFSTRRIAVVVSLIAVIAYLLLSGVKVPALRASIGVSIAMLGVMFGRDPLTLRLVAFAAFLVLLWQPESLLSPSFQLSFAAVTSLVILANSPFARRWLHQQSDDGVLIKTGRMIAALLISSLVAEIVLTPIALAHFGRTGAYGVLSNMVGIPLTSVFIMPLLGLWLALMPFGLEGLVGWALANALKLLTFVATTVSSWPGARAEMSAISTLSYGLIISGSILLALLLGRLRWLGAPLLAAGIALVFLQPRPLMLVSPDRRQVALIEDGHLYLRAGHRNGLLVRTWAEATRSTADRRMYEWLGANCDNDECVVQAGRFSILATVKAPRSCAYDIVISASVPGETCRPRLLLVDRTDRQGALAINRKGNIESVAKRSGDHPWSPSAEPGVQYRLIGGRRWIGVMAE